MSILPKHLRYLVTWFASPARARGRPTRPSLLNLPITDNCNSRCVMCDVWKTESTGEMGPDGLRQALEDPFFRDLKHVGLSGGEPTLREDLPEIMGVLLDVLPRLESLSVTTHGFHPLRWERFLPPVSAACARRRVRLTINVSIDGVGAMHDRVRGVPGGFAQVERSLAVAAAQRAAVQLQATVSSPNVYGVTRLLRWAQHRRLPIAFRAATVIPRLANRDSLGDVGLDAGQRSFFADFLESRALLEATPNPARRLFYRDLAHRLRSGAARRAPCSFQSEGVLVSQHGELFHCSISERRLGELPRESAGERYFSPEALAARDRLLADECPGCLHDQSGAWTPWTLAGEVLRSSALGRSLQYAADALRLARRAAGASLVRPSAPAASPIRTAVLFGAYGGEHVGDAALLGGVVKRLLTEHRLERGVVASFRPDRTRFWLSGLELGIPIEVLPYSLEALAPHLGPGALAVHAGGPLMDLPKLLAQHLELAAEARRRGVAVWFEGIGIGPFRTAASRLLARRLLALADRTRVRSQHDAAADLLVGPPPPVVGDPAFDYLAGRAQLSRLLPREAEAVEAVLGTDDVPRVAINLRPLWHKYVPRGSPEALLARFLDGLAEAMKRLAADSPVRFVFFAMNADQYGFSDLDVAAALDERVRELDFRICEHELGVDGVLALLRRVDVVLAMRFHAAIFALAEERRVVGIDYSQAGNGKVHALFSERGLAADVGGIASCDAAWLEGKLRECLNERAP